jgi:hypothetical protein
VRKPTAKERVRRDLRRLFRCMDQVAKHPALARPPRNALSGMLGEIYPRRRRTADDDLFIRSW